MTGVSATGFCLGCEEHVVDSVVKEWEEDSGCPPGERLYHEIEAVAYEKTPYGNVPYPYLEFCGPVVKA